MGDRGRAIKPVLADSKMPKGAMSFRNESILDCLADLVDCQSLMGKTQHRSMYLHLDDTAIRADIQHLAAKLVRKVRDATQVLVLVP